MSNLVQENYKKILIRKSAYLFFGKAMPVIVLFIITILYSRRLSYDDYGRFQSIWMYTNIINVILSFGIISVLLSSNLSFLFAFVKRHSTKLVLYYLALWIVVPAIFFLYAKNFNASLKYLLVLFIFIQNISAVSETLLLKYHREKIVLVINVIYSILFLGWHYYILNAGFSLERLVKGIIIIALLKFLLMIFIKGKEEGVAQITTDRIFSRHWLYLGANDITGVLSKWIDKLLLLYLVTPADFAVFFNGSFEIPLFGLLISVIGSVMLIEISKKVSSNEKIESLFNESFHLLSCIVFPLFLFLLFFRADLFAIIFKHKYDISLPVFLISVFILPVRINNYSSILQYYHKGNKIMAGSILDICVEIALMIALYPFYGTKGVALAVVIATYCQVFYYLWQSAQVLNTRMYSLVPLKALSVTFAVLLVIFAGLYLGLSKTNEAIRLVAGSITTVVVIAIGLLFYFSRKSSGTYGLTKKI